MFNSFFTEDATSRMQLVNSVGCKERTEHNYTVWAVFLNVKVVRTVTTVLLPVRVHWLLYVPVVLTVNMSPFC